MLEWKRSGLTQDILDKHVTLSGGTDSIPHIIDVLNAGRTDLCDWEEDEWYCVLPEIAMPEKPVTEAVVLRAKYIGQSNRCVTHGKVYDVTLHGIGYFHLTDDEGEPNSYYHSNFQLVEDVKPVVKHTRRVMLEEWAAHGETMPCAEFMWRVVGYPEPGDSSWFRTGATRQLDVPIRELEVPNGK